MTLAEEHGFGDRTLGAGMDLAERERGEEGEKSCAVGQE
jgi:hypothetical protein